MASDQLRALHPRRAGIGDAIARAIPITFTHPDERKLLRRADIREAVRK